MIQSKITIDETFHAQTVLNHDETSPQPQDLTVDMHVCTLTLRVGVFGAGLVTLA